jgi:hypothetical protein
MSDAAFAAVATFGAMSCVIGAYTTRQGIGVVTSLGALASIAFMVVGRFAG